MSFMSGLKELLGIYEPLGEVVYYQAKSRKWRWKVVNEDGKTVVNPIRSFHTRDEAVQSFYDAQAIMDSL